MATDKEISRRGHSQDDMLRSVYDRLSGLVWCKVWHLTSPSKPRLDYSDGPLESRLDVDSEPRSIQTGDSIQVLCRQSL